MGLRACLFGIALTCFALRPQPLPAEVACTAREDLPLIYSPDEPPVCPDPPFSMADLVPSTIGRPPAYMSEFLAGCAGFMDAIVTIKPEASNLPEFVSGDVFFSMAKEWRERPPIRRLEARRNEGKQYWLEWLGPEFNTGGSMFPHDFGACMDEVRIRADH